ncbi:MAG: type VI secretion system tube protein Hcp [Planctomycetes bacterium]|nr:type VI secretion system tube protein Hcp [Planctomycetota bacterium]
MASTRSGFVKFGDFEGEATDSKHLGWSIMHSLSAPLTRATGGFEQSERGVGATAVGQVTVVKDLDSASVKIQKACVSGQKLSKVKVELCTTTGGATQPYLIYELEDAIVTAYDLEDPADSKAIQPTERVSFTYGKATWTYAKFGTDGASQGKVTDNFTVGAAKK